MSDASLIGLLNPPGTNSCWVNSVIQILYGIPEVAEAVRAHDCATTACTPECVMACLQLTFNRLDTEPTAFEAAALRHALGNKLAFAEGAQHDATEVLLSPRPPHCNVPHCNAPHCSARTPPAITAQPWPQVMVVACERWYSPDSTHAATGTAQAIHCPRTLEASSQSERYELAFCLVHEGHARDGGHWWVVDQTTTDPLILNEDNVELLTESSYDSYDVATQWVSAVYVLRANMLEEEGVLASLDEAAVTNELEYDWDATSGGDSGINSSHDGLGPAGPAALPLPGIGSLPVP
ncbi:uncharacterized protein EHS24_008418 [Apiotrichum porosum]|uniref:Peptidase C19 ubiquitin carboxyl-terminal hydrolase domain-containing protein n=1 Tax=Apiotrichum porosum TaxID=105984 RepID=A0A427XQ93_9TREE|nr:uncharacterized protein EHS24_008418 [Apiotrichum porosum]RSH80987.1 hypothetical protein EHS24_008418 [Apiotrichum porosum]